MCVWQYIEVKVDIGTLYLTQPHTERLGILPLFMEFNDMHKHVFFSTGLKSHSNSLIAVSAQD